MGKKGILLNVRLSERELEVIRNIKDARGHETISDAIRELIRFAEVYFDDRLTVEVAFKPHILKMVRENFDLFTKYPVSDLLKSVPELENALKGVKNET
jgi:hypothetical protein